MGASGLNSRGCLCVRARALALWAAAEARDWEEFERPFHFFYIHKKSRVKKITGQFRSHAEAENFEQLQQYLYANYPERMHIYVCRYDILMLHVYISTRKQLGYR